MIFFNPNISGGGEYPENGPILDIWEFYSEFLYGNL